MADYIDRNELIGNLDKFAPEHFTPLIRTLIEKQSAVDVEEVVRCVECGFRDDNFITTSQDIDCYMCKRYHSLVLLDDFCSYGERRDT